MKIFWFIPTHGDSRYLGTAKGARQLNHDYLKQVAIAADSLGYEGVLIPTGRSCEDLIALLTSELEGQRGCSEDADCHWESILPPTGDCYAPLGNVTSLDFIHEIEGAVMQQDCLITKTDQLCGPVVIGPAVCREGRCEL